MWWYKAEALTQETEKNETGQSSTQNHTVKNDPELVPRE